MVQDWLIEIGKGIGKVFLNPLLYWAIALIIFVGIRRIKQERKYFGTKVFDVLTEWKDTIGFSLLIGLFYSIVTIAVGMVLSVEAIFVFSMVTIILSLTLRFSLLSPSYTIGITVVLLMLSPLLDEYITFIPKDIEVNFSVLVILLALFLFVEAHFINRIRQNETYPELTLGSRGSWIGRHRIKRIAIIPFLH
ncbi:hypothetical protein [Ornithinibacillus scapharcae]|uniref:hypothetical protein n=1 Tax=Ornithinibacillus scapharcae TaxID=1147159 RepID=UPI000225B12B|nr:hypothetical protein [Ornithinibacillus scapharcae]